MGLNMFLLAGEASGDLHGANLAKALLHKDPSIQLDGWGGPKMNAAGVKLHRELKDLAFMGFVEVIANLPTIQKSFKIIKKYLLENKPDALILIDYPGFNLKMAKWAHQNGIKVFYFISPTVWAWKADRALIIKEHVDRLYCILPFEVDFYKKYDVDVTYVGNPLLDSVDAFRPDVQFFSNNNLTERSYISVLPGSRMQELKKIFPVMVSAMKLLPVKQFVIARTSLLSEELFIEILNKYHPAWKSHVQIITDKTYDLLQHTSSAMVTSGTATLETALFHVPQVVCYKTIPLNFRIAKSFVNVKYISLVNLIANKPIVKELIQGDLTPENLKAELALLEEDVKYRNKILEEYKELAKMIGEPGVAERMAEDMVERLKDFV